MGEKNGGGENFGGKKVNCESEGSFCAVARDAPWIGPGPGPVLRREGLLLKKRFWADLAKNFTAFLDLL